MGVGVWHYLSGYVIIDVKGRRLERFINRAVQGGVEIWRIRRTGTDRLTACVSVKGFYAMRPIVRECGVRVAILQKHGPIMALSRLRERKVLLFGWVLVLALLLASSRCIWFITVEGCDRVEKALVLDALKELGVQAGALRTQVPTYRLGTRIMAADERIAWAGAELEGVILRVTIVESDPAPISPDKSEPASIYARCDGVIKRVVVIDGKAKVTAGQAVLAGDELITGVLRDDEEGMFLTTHAQGEVLAEVLYRFSATAGPALEEQMPTGKQEKVTRLELFGKAFQAEPGFAAWTEEIAEARRFTGCFLPIRVSSVLCRETQAGQRMAGREELVPKALALAEAEMLRLLPKDAKITSKRSETVINEEGGVTAMIIVTTEENIGITRGIDGKQD